MDIQDIIAQIPENWLSGLQKELNEMVEVVASQFSRILAEDLDVDPDNSDNFWLEVAKKTQTTTVQAQMNFSRVCLENSKMELFRHQYKELMEEIQKQYPQQLPKELVDRILGDTEQEVRQAYGL